MPEDLIPKSKLQRLAIDAAAEAGVSCSARLLLCTLVALSWPSDSPGDGWAVGQDERSAASQRRLGDLVGCSTRHVKRLAEELAGAGLIRLDPGRGQVSTIYTLTVSNLTPVSGLTCHPRQVRPDTHVRSDLTPTSGLTCHPRQVSSSKESVISTPPPPGDGGGGWVDPARGLEGRAAVVYPMIARRPEWFGGAWISSSRARELAERESTTPTVVQAALRSAKGKRGSLRNVPGYVIARICEPDHDEIVRERRRQAAEVERDERQRIARAEAAAARRAEARSTAAADEDTRRAEALAASMSSADLAAAIESYTRTTSGFERDLLENRTTDERVRYLARRGRLGLALQNQEVTA